MHCIATLNTLFYHLLKLREHSLTDFVTGLHTEQHWFRFSGRIAFETIRFRCLYQRRRRCWNRCERAVMYNVKKDKRKTCRNANDFICKTCLVSNWGKAQHPKPNLTSCPSMVQHTSEVNGTIENLNGGALVNGYTRSKPKAEWALVKGDVSTSTARMYGAEVNVSGFYQNWTIWMLRFRCNSFFEFMWM